MAQDVLQTAREAVLDEAHLSAQPHTPQARPRFPGAYEDACWARDPQASAGQEPEASRSCDSLQVGVDTHTTRFRRANRLLVSREFRDVGRRGQRASSVHFTLLVADGAARQRLGITVGKKVGNAVERNRVKRGIREWFRQSRGGMRSGIEIVVIARPAANELRGAALRDALDRLVARAGARQ